MSRISGCFEKLKKTGRKALVPYMTAGDPNPGMTVALMHQLVESGADVIELGVPFSDPMADGPVIQRAAERALVHNVSLRDVFDMVRRFREKDSATPVVLMGYLNPMEVMGCEEFCQLATDTIDGVLTVDMPPEEAIEWIEVLQKCNVDPIFLLAPTTDDNRIKLISEVAGGYLYYVALKGITGAGNLDVQDVAKKLQQIRQYTKLPIGVGFGIKDGPSAAEVAAVADAVVVGSALIQQIEQHISQDDKIIPAVGDFVRSLRQAIDQSREPK